MKEKYNLFQQVELANDIPSQGLIKGDVATIVEVIEAANGNGYCLEFFDSDGDTLCVIVVKENEISPLTPHAVVNYRKPVIH